MDQSVMLLNLEWGSQIKTNKQKKKKGKERKQMLAITMLNIISSLKKILKREMSLHVTTWLVNTLSLHFSYSNCPIPIKDL